MTFPREGKIYLKPFFCLKRCYGILPSFVFPLLFWLPQNSQSPKAGHPKAGRSDFRNQRFKPDTGENAENADVRPTPGKQGSEEIPQNENAENAEKCGKCGRENAENAENADDWL